MTEIWFTERQEEHSGLTVRVRDVLFSGKSKYQEVQILDTYSLGKVLVLDNTYQTTERDEAYYHEALAHIPLFTHPNPRHVLVVGGGDGGTVREVLKHSSVESVDLVEIDEIVVRECKKHMPALSKGFSDKRANIIFQDGAKYVKETDKKYDVVIVDSPDPVGPAVVLFEKEFYENIKKILNPDGLMVEQTESPLFSKDFVINIRKTFKEVFPIVRQYLTVVYTYPGATWSFTMGSLKYDPLEVDEGEIEKRFEGMETKIYYPEIHKSFFALPRYIKEEG